ncbi:MAG: M48 family metalloprotease [Anaerolineaceae bacterium]|nr:M48 family metalloprotease [Anaerolineaceae bacterium]
MQIRILIGVLLSLVVALDGRPPADGLTGLAGLTWLGWAIAVVIAVGAALRGGLAILVRRGVDPQRLFSWHQRAVGLYGLLALALYAALLYLAHWPQTVRQFLPPWMGGDFWLPQRLLILLPLLLLVLVTWCAGLTMTRAVRRALSGADLPTTGARLRLGSYLLFQTRLQMLVFLAPYVFVLGLHDLVVLVGAGRLDPASGDLVVLPAVIAVYVLSPLMLRLVWSTERLPDGPLRQRLLRAAERTSVYVRDIILWRTNGLMVNACVSGLGWPLRYVFLTDTLVDGLQPAQAEAVFCHELGHAKFRHIPFFFLVALGGVMGLSLLVPVLQWLGISEQFAMGGGVAFLLVYWGGFFGFLSRRFERQSDLFAARMVDCPGDRDAHACAEHRPGQPPQPDLVCANKAWAFSSALQEIALLNGTALASGSWRHFGVGRRVQFIAETVGRPDLVRRYDHRLRVFKWLFVLGLLTLAAIILMLTVTKVM